MKTTTIIAKGWSNMPVLAISDSEFMDSFGSIRVSLLLNGFIRLDSFENLCGKNANEKVIVKAWYWRGEWSTPTKEIYAIFYK